MSESQRGLAAIMLTDMVGFTALAQKDETIALELLEHHRQVLRPIFAKHRGREIKTMGDAFLVEFNSALEATLCAIDIQSTLNDRRLEQGVTMQVRIGIHLGDVVHRGGDVLGDAVNIVSRIEPLAEPGGICISGRIYDDVRNKIGYHVSKLSTQQLKNVKDQIDIYSLSLPWQRNQTEQAAVSRMDKRRIAVLPFSNISPDVADAYIADGMTEEMISTLATIKGLNVISRTTVLQYRDVSKAVAVIGRELNAGLLLEGSVRKAGNKVRITVQLLDADEDRHLWAEKYDRDLADIFTVQSEIAEHVAHALKTELLSDAKERIERGSTTNEEAHTLYLKARYRMSSPSNERLLKAIEYLDVAVKQDPNYALAHAALAECYTYLAGEAFSQQEAFPKAMQHALKAIELNSKLAEGHSCLGILAIQYEWNWRNAEQELNRAIDLNPSYSTAHTWLGIYFTLFDRFDEAILKFKQAEELDPLSEFVKSSLGLCYYRARSYEEAAEKLLEANEMAGGSELSHTLLGYVYLAKSMRDDAIHEFEKAKELGQISSVLGGLGYAYAASGRREEALQTLETLTSKHISASDTDIAILQVGLGDLEVALDFLEKALQKKDAGLVLWGKFHLFDSLRSNPRYVKIIQATGLPV
jgi:TolB-like protein